MTARLLTPDQEGIAAAARALAGGGLVVFPTDTVYGVACLATDAGARARFYAAKARDPSRPAILMVASTAQAEPWVELSGRARELAEAHWPGPLTLVLRATPAAQASLGEILGERTLGIRVPGSPVALRLLEAAPGPLATSSANRTGESAPLTGAEAMAALGEYADVVLDGRAEIGLASSILDLSRDTPRLLREGSIPAQRLLR